MREFLAALAADRPVVLLLDDLHWADPPSLDLLRPLARALGGLPVLLIATYRPEDVARNNQLLRNNVEKSLGTALTTQQAQTQNLINDVFSGNGLRQQNIAIRGSRIRIQGRNLPQNEQLTINGESYPVDLERKFVAEYLSPIGRHSFDIGLGGSGKEPGQHYTLDVDVTGRYFFGVGIAGGVTLAQRKTHAHS